MTSVCLPSNSSSKLNINILKHILNEKFTKVNTTNKKVPSWETYLQSKICYGCILICLFLVRKSYFLHIFNHVFTYFLA